MCVRVIYLLKLIKVMVVLKKANGFVLLDKPAGITSFQAVKRAEKILGSDRSGHTGTLDFNVTGLLVIALGEARKTLPLMMELDKTYEGIMHVHGVVAEQRLVDVFREFTGKIEQMPPVRSRVARKTRLREIFSLELDGKDGRDVRFHVHCQHGTYVRKLVHDIGERLGCGAHMSSLRRTAVGCFSINEAKPPERLSDNDIITISDTLERIGVKHVWLMNKESVVRKIRNGNPVRMCMIRKHDNIHEGEGIGIFQGRKIIAVGLALLDSDDWTKKKLLVKTDRVLNI